MESVGPVRALTTGKEKSSAPKKTKVKVIVRARPSLSCEGNDCCIKICQEVGGEIVERKGAVGNILELRNHKVPGDILKYSFDACYDKDATQEEIFTNEIRPLVGAALKGINTTVFAYGITGSGKTHTMQGSTDNPGLIPRTAKQLLYLAKKKEERKEIEKITVNVSYLEIYNEKIMDLLVHPSKRKGDLPVREDHNRNILVPQLTERTVSTFEEFTALYDEGCSNRTVASTKLNPTSSRSHAILVMKVTVFEEAGRTVSGKLHMIDLAGSEDNRRTGNTGIRLTESSSINTSLFVLGKVVDALNTGLSRVPYRDSKLTRLLQDSLGGRSIGVMFANIAPGNRYFPETHNTLNFASKSREIVNDPMVHAEEKPVVVKVASRSLNGIGSARRGSSEVAAGKKRKVQSSTDGYAKENREHSPQDSKEIEERLRQRLEEELICPLIKKRKFLDDSTMQRLERLERKVVEQAQEATMMALDENVARKGARAPLSPTLSSALTPCGKARTARNLIIEAKHLESNGQLRDALLFYSKAARLIPENDKLKLKVKGLRADVEAEENVEMVDATNHAKVKGSLVQKLQEASEKRLSSGKSKKLAGTKPKPAQVMLKDITNTNREGSGGARAGKKPQKMKLASSWNCEEDDDNHSLITSEEDDEDEDFEDPGERDDVPWPGLEDVEATVLQILKGGERKALLKLKGIGPKRADAILDYRVEKPITKIWDLIHVGFGERFLETFVQNNADVQL